LNEPSADIAIAENLSMPKLWREGSWISAAVAALLIALFTSHDGISEQRLATVDPPVTIIPKTATASPSPSTDSDATRQVSRSVRDLTDDLGRITTRLAAVERSIDDLTNTVMQQNAPSKEASTQTLPSWTKQETVPSTVAAAPASGVMPLDTRPTTTDTSPASANPPVDGAAATPSDYGAEIGTAVSMKMLLSRWTELRSAHAEVFDGLKPVAVVKDNARTNRVELRLVVSAANRSAAAKLCTTLTALRIACQPVSLDGQQVALQ
jgi:hypothetical protein